MEGETDDTTIEKLASATGNDIQVQTEVQIQEQELDQDLDDEDIVDLMEKDLHFTGDYDIDNDNDGGNLTLLSVADKMLSDVSDREDSGSHHDKRQSHQEDELPERMRSEYSRSDDKSTSDESTSKESSSNKSTRND